MRRLKYSLPKVACLRNNAEYKRVFDRAAKSSDDKIVVLGRSNQIGLARIGLAISKKCSKHAVQRNRIKRLARESFRAIRNDLQGVDFVVVCRSRAVTATNVELLNAITRHIQKVHARLCGTF